MSGLSSRVMNMKFMRSTGDEPKNEPKDQEPKKVKDSSEWSSKKSHQLLAHNKTNNVQTVGYGSIHMFSDDDEDEDDVNSNNNHETLPKTIKRTWGSSTNDSAMDTDKPALDFGSIKDSTKTTSKPQKPQSKPKPLPSQEPQFGNDNDNSDFLNKVFQPKKRANDDARDEDSKTDESKPQIKHKRKRIKK